MTESVNTEELILELQRKNQQIEALRNAYLELQNKNNDEGTNQIMSHVKHMPVFTGHGDVTVNSFIRNVEYYLDGINNEDSKKTFTLAIYHERIQGEAKNTVINIPQPDNWNLLKATLKLRYKPDIEPFQLYRRISNLRVNNVSELATEIQEIKYKADELIIYHENNSIDLSNVNGILVNTIKEKTQGTLLDRIYEEQVLENILLIMRKRRYEDSCIRPEFLKDKTKYKNTRQIDFNPRQNRTDNNEPRNKVGNYNYFNNYHNNFRSNNHPNVPKVSQSGQNRRQYQQFGNNRNSGQYRQQDNRQLEPMDVSNIEKDEVNNKQLPNNQNNHVSVNEASFFMN